MKNKETERDTEHTFPVSYGMTVKTTQCYNDFNTFDQGQVIPNSLRTCDKLFHLGTWRTVDTLRMLPGEKIPRALHVCPFVGPTVKWRLHDTARCITGCTTGCIVYTQLNKSECYQKDESSHTRTVVRECCKGDDELYR